MKLQAIVSSVALAAALSFSGAGAAMAQNMLNGVAIPTEQIQNFNDKCEALRAASTASLATPTELNDDDEDATDPTETGSVAATPPAEDSDPAARGNWDEALASLTIEQCEAAGFVAQ